MSSSLLRPLRRFLRAPATIVGELGFLTAASALGAALPQVGSAAPEELAALRQHGPAVAALVEALALDRIFTSPAFLAATLLAALSLLLVVQEQVRRFVAAWRQSLSEAHFRNPAFHISFLRPARAGASPVRLWSTGRLGMAGSLCLHAGLLAVIAAAALRSLFGVTAAVDLLEQETLPPTVAAWGAQWPGPLARPFQLEGPLTLEAVDLDWYPDGDLRDIAIRFRTPDGSTHRLGINEAFTTPHGRLSVSAAVGPAALVAWSPRPGDLRREALLLRQGAPGQFTATTGTGTTLHARAHLDPGNPRATSLDVRVMEGPALRFAGRLAPGETVGLPGGGELELVGLPSWARLQASRDPGLPLVYAGFLLGLIGAAATYAIVRVDHRVMVTPEDGQERVLVEMNPHRFAPLFREGFERLVRSEGGTP